MLSTFLVIAQSYLGHFLNLFKYADSKSAKTPSTSKEIRRCDVHIEDSIKNFLDLNSKGIPCLLYNNKANQHLGPILRIYSLEEDEISDVYWLAKEMGVFDDFCKYFNP